MASDAIYEHNFQVNMVHHHQLMVDMVVPSLEAVATAVTVVIAVEAEVASLIEAAVVDYLTAVVVVVDMAATEAALVVTAVVEAVTLTAEGECQIAVAAADSPIGAAVVVDAVDSLIGAEVVADAAVMAATVVAMTINMAVMVAIVVDHSIGAAIEAVAAVAVEAMAADVTTDATWTEGKITI